LKNLIFHSDGAGDEANYTLQKTLCRKSRARELKQSNLFSSVSVWAQKSSFCRSRPSAPRVIKAADLAFLLHHSAGQRTMQLENSPASSHMMEEHTQVAEQQWHSLINSGAINFPPCWRLQFIAIKVDAKLDKYWLWLPVAACVRRSTV
jgi:hypothetical protein